MTISESLSNTSAKLNHKSDSPQLDAEVLMSFVLNKDKTFLFRNPDYRLSQAQERKFATLLDKRAKHWPVAYLTGFKEFFGLKFKVNPNVLIPRPRTETLVEYAVVALKDMRNLNILDVGTGSGAIIISLAKTLGKKHKYFAVDVSGKALQVARANARRLKADVWMGRSSLLNAVPKLNFDVIVANLPYLAKQTHPSTTHEPNLALVAKSKGMHLYQQLFNQIKSKQLSPKFIFVECDPPQTKFLKRLGKEYAPDSQLIIVDDKKLM